MTDQKKPEELQDDDLDAAQGGYIAFGTETTTLKGKRKRDSLEPDKARGGGVSQKQDEI